MATPPLASALAPFTGTPRSTAAQGPQSLLDAFLSLLNAFSVAITDPAVDGSTSESGTQEVKPAPRAKGRNKDGIPALIPQIQSPISQTPAQVPLCASIPIPQPDPVSRVFVQGSESHVPIRGTTDGAEPRVKSEEVPLQVQRPPTSTLPIASEFSPQPFAQPAESAEVSDNVQVYTTTETSAQRRVAFATQFNTRAPMVFALKLEGAISQDNSKDEQSSTPIPLSIPESAPQPKASNAPLLAPDRQVPMAPPPEPSTQPNPQSITPEYAQAQSYPQVNRATSAVSTPKGVPTRQQDEEKCTEVVSVKASQPEQRQQQSTEASGNSAQSAQNTPHVTTIPAHIESGFTNAVESRNSSVAVEKSKSSEPAAEISETNAGFRPQPTREISMRVSRAETAPVDIKLVDRAGSIRVAVRTPDGELANNLQSGLSDLVHRLERKGFETEAWSPSENGGPASSQFMLPNRDGGAAQHGSRDPRDASQQGSGGQQQNGRNRPKWVDELERKLAKGEPE